jgi:hypothetical protein
MGFLRFASFMRDSHAGTLKSNEFKAILLTKAVSDVPKFAE